MQPKNKSERTKAFINFLLLFSLSILLISATVFLSTDVPVKQAKDLRNQLNEVERQQLISARFRTKMAEIVAMVDSVDKSKDPEFVDTQIKQKIDHVQLSADTDSAYDQPLYQSVVKNMYDLWKAKKQLRQANALADKVNQLETDKVVIQQKLDAKIKEYNDLYIQVATRR